MEKKKIGLLVMAYGTPYKEEDIEPYYTHIRHGRKPDPEALQDLKERYEAIGGISPLAKITEEQTKALEKKLNANQDQYEFKAYIGLKHIHPFIEDTVEEMAKDGIKEAISLVLAPHYSTFSVKSYNKRANETAEKYGIQLDSVEDWYTEPGFIKFWADGIKATYAEMTEEERNNSVLIVSAHSLPEKILKDGDPYKHQLEETAKLIVEEADVKNYAVGWQSEGNTPDPWLGPDVQDLTRELYESEGYKAFIYTPVGFVADHLEVLYDNDYECKVVCDEIGASYYRPDMPNVHPEFIETLANVVMKKAKSEVR
ncbi:ferrochelatase [Oceanobacillus iheyensis HTE831]|uniref:Coproporphyrin III ferrochelatase n=1 Tax=Oceanobacillus iheyensis (strain DSM 14371 / CIP 107618 / JCM 11309 / KCTC 3954 / HTE831) TaxID=221109 RepID=CPFC_OCEIH|nr:ferrochelatase [Oceanobacillus iheyensis]Q8ERX9.1 RecName: Full=Coproporphyrin III ferrochelatase [Oceanobacillus iheyensis HTE831]BAC13124.1 ferrochelatase [Oceanobacillus iheyensis HTE831]